MGSGALSSGEIRLMLAADALYQGDYESLRADIEKIRGMGRLGLSGHYENRGICLALALGALDASGMDRSGTLHRLLKGGCRCTGDGSEWDAAHMLVSLYGGDLASLKADLAKLGLAGGVDAKDCPKERCACLRLFLLDLDGLAALGRMADVWERRMGKKMEEGDVLDGG